MDGEKTFKILAAYHQYFAVKKAIESTKHATVTDGKGGVFWHTQGSGKSLSMVFYAHYLQEALESPTIVVITDRNDLDDQLYGQFARCKDFLRQTPQHAQSRTHLKELLANRQANGIIFTTMQKFEESDEPLSERRNIIVMADEAHRSQYGLTEKVVVRQKEDGEVDSEDHHWHCPHHPGHPPERYTHRFPPVRLSLLRIAAPVKCSVIISIFMI